MAAQIIKAWGGRSVVSSVTIDASTGTPRVDVAEHAHLSNLVSGGALSWTEIDDALPLPFAQWQRPAANGGIWQGEFVPLILSSSQVTESINSQPLRVIGLSKGNYSLTVDGRPIGTFSNDALANGINLATLDTPMSEQAKEVYDLTVIHCDVHRYSWRTVEVPLAKYNLPSASTAMESSDALEQAVVRKRFEIAQPKPHSFVLTPVE
jgi:hypothetical protein